jgi:anti-sigma B factor antagonist
VLNIEIKTMEGVEFIILEGEIDMYVAPQIRGALLNAGRVCEKAVAIDLNSVSYMDSSGIATLIEGLQVTKRRGARLVLFGVHPNVMDMLKLAKLHDFFEIYQTEKEALDNLC